MRRSDLFVLIIVPIIVVVCGAARVFAIKPEDTPAARAQGKVIYERSCLFCHGVGGNGDGSSGWFIGRYSAPRPRDFTAEGFKLRSTGTGELPTDQDLFRTVTRGIPGYMPPFNGLTEEERWQVVAYVKSFNPAFENEERQPLHIGSPLPSSEDLIELGRRSYTSDGCVNCHGPNGRGDGRELLKETLKDARGLRLKVADLTDPAAFKNGATAQDVYRTIMTGMDGTPMPSHLQLFSGRDEVAWGLVYYVLSLSGHTARR